MPQCFAEGIECFLEEIDLLLPFGCPAASAPDVVLGTAARSRNRLREPLPPCVARFKVHGDEAQVSRDAESEVEEALPFPLLGTGTVDLEHRQTRGQLPAGAARRIEARAEDDVLRHTAARLLLDDIFNEARTTMERGRAA
ncbi:MAG TPA: hypothetical protein VM166_00060 [Gemmatimonadaceae bacterium]|nr:hypothetical protein [Gemmatimonadaceae bacterium]